MADDSYLDEDLDDDDETLGGMPDPVLDIGDTADIDEVTMSGAVSPGASDTGSSAAAGEEAGMARPPRTKSKGGARRSAKTASGRGGAKRTSAAKKTSGARKSGRKSVGASGRKRSSAKRSTAKRSTAKRSTKRSTAKRSSAKRSAKGRSSARKSQVRKGTKKGARRR